MDYAKEALKFFIFLILWTAIGPIKIKGESLENHYHILVNSNEFKDKYRDTMWILARPITWTGEKLSGLFQDSVPEEARGR